jgi:hypothetical protein
MRTLSRSMRSSEAWILSGCWCARPIAACRRASGERSSCETSCSRRRWPSIRVRSWALMRSKSWPSSASSSPATARLAGEFGREVAGGGGFEGAAQRADGARKIPGEEGGEQEAGQGRGDDRQPAADMAPELRRQAEPAAAAPAAGTWPPVRAASAGRSRSAAAGGPAAVAPPRMPVPLAPPVAALARAGHARGKGQVAPPVRCAQPGHGVGLVFAGFEIAFDFLAQPGGDGASEQFVALVVEHVQAHAAAVRGQVAQAVDAAVPEGRGGRVEHDDGGRADVEGRFAVALARLVAQPDGAADADRGRHLGEQDRQEELPEQPAHRYSRISW